MEKKKLRVAVLMGGTSAEREVSLKSGVQVLNALDAEKYEVFALDTKSGALMLPGGARAVSALTDASGTTVTELAKLSSVVSTERPDVVFIALHGPGGEDGAVQGFLQTLGIPYTGSGILASALAMDKVRYKQFLTASSVPTPAGISIRKSDGRRRRSAEQETGTQLGFPVVVKPNQQGSSKGTFVVHEAEGLREAIAQAFRFDDTVLIEERVTGVEITVAVLGNNDESLFALPPVEIVAKDGFFDYTAKYATGENGAIEICPARISEADTEEAKSLALECHRLLGCRGMSRTDMFVTEDGCVVLETNTIPGMTETSLLPKAAKAAGLEFSVLLDRLIEYALEK
jgi:D-alanine-D-alanine ligase